MPELGADLWTRENNFTFSRNALLMRVRTMFRTRFFRSVRFRFSLFRDIALGTRDEKPGASLMGPLNSWQLVVGSW
jgi:hypothetical protein